MTSTSNIRAGWVLVGLFADDAQLRKGLKDATGQAVPGLMDLPEGWHALPMPSN